MRSAHIAMAFATMVCLTGCAGGAPERILPEGASAADAPLAADIGAACSGVVYDYEPFTSTDELAAIADLVVRGRVAGVYGQAGGDVPGVSHFIVRIDVAEVLVGGAASSGGEETSEVEMRIGAPVGLTAADCSEVLPPGTGVVLYATEAPDDRIDSSEQTPVYLPLQQGFVVESAGGRLDWPLIGVTGTGALVEALPGGTATGAQPG